MRVRERLQAAVDLLFDARSFGIRLTRRGSHLRWEADERTVSALGLPALLVARKAAYLEALVLEELAPLGIEVVKDYLGQVSFLPSGGSVEACEAISRAAQRAQEKFRELPPEGKAARSTR